MLNDMRYGQKGLLMMNSVMMRQNNIQLFKIAPTTMIVF